MSIRCIGSEVEFSRGKSQESFQRPRRERASTREGQSSSARWEKRNSSCCTGRERQGNLRHRKYVSFPNAAGQAHTHAATFPLLTARNAPEDVVIPSPRTQQVDFTTVARCSLGAEAARTGSRSTVEKVHRGTEPGFMPALCRYL